LLLLANAAPLCGCIDANIALVIPVHKGELQPQ